MITPQEIEIVLEQLVGKELTARAAIAQLVASGLPAGDATEAVFVALGGSDIVQDDRYRPSGRLVVEVEADMRR